GPAARHLPRGAGRRPGRFSLSSDDLGRNAARAAEDGGRGVGRRRQGSGRFQGAREPDRRGGDLPADPRRRPVDPAGRSGGEDLRRDGPRRDARLARRRDGRHGAAAQDRDLQPESRDAARPADAASQVPHRLPDDGQGFWPGEGERRAHRRGVLGHRPAARQVVRRVAAYGQAEDRQRRSRSPDRRRDRKDQGRAAQVDHGHHDLPGWQSAEDAEHDGGDGARQFRQGARLVRRAEGLRAARDDAPDPRGGSVSEGEERPTLGPIIPLASREIFTGRTVHLKIDTVRMPNGVEVDLERVYHVGAAAIVPVTVEGDVLLVRQARWATGGWLLEIPAGKLDRTAEGTEVPEVCAARELEEETGHTAGRLEPLGWIWATPGFAD